MAVEHGRVGHRPRRHDAGHVAVDQGPAAVQTADLLADGDFVTGRDEPGDVPSAAWCGIPAMGTRTPLPISLLVSTMSRTRAAVSASSSKVS